MADIQLPSQKRIPRLGLGTWYMGENKSQRQQEVAALRFGIEYGAKLIDTAEMYGEGEAELITGEAMRGYRDNLYLVSKFYPHHAGRKQVITACERSLRRLNTDHLDLYLLHWRGSVPFAETLEALYQLREQGKIVDYGVSNLDLDDMQEWCDADQLSLCATNQVLYNLKRREADYALKPFMDSKQISLMAYCPLDQGHLLQHPVLRQLAERHDATTAQIALAWLLAQKGVIAIPKSTHLERVKENLDAAELLLTQDDLHLLNEAFPQPKSARDAQLQMR
ncbi:aldo/keto reductase [Vibrio porteresiae]|uniref:Aldo/keto reductase n=1 Tax=Vibrio porteresiae DSM 19223 TaxID=1123496 RepID=A0ABZ0QF88_9VIBR|nr:aldo/keto reductase [Vibrio porteresiae]WPC75146.1 aldo/keto reductase [Vibrio porteresiae DSM 19223]